MLPVGFIPNCRLFVNEHNLAIFATELTWVMLIFDTLRKSIELFLTVDTPDLVYGPDKAANFCLSEG